MSNGEKVMFAGCVVTIRGSHSHITTGRVSYLVEYANGVYARAGAESLARIEPEPYRKTKLRALTSMAAGFLRQPGKLKRVLK